MESSVGTSGTERLVEAPALPWPGLVAELAGRIARGARFDETFEAAWARLRRLAPCDRLSAAVLNARRDELTVLAVRSSGRAALGAGYKGPVAGSSLAEVLEEEKARVIPDLEERLARRPGSEPTRLIVEEGLRSSMAVPLPGREAPIGAVFFSSREPDAWRPEHEELLRGVAACLAVAIERSRVDEDLRDRSAWLRELRKELARSQSLAAVGELAATVAHEIKNPLAGISGAIQVLAQTIPAGDGRREVVGEILEQIRRLDNTVRDLLGFARPAAPQREELRVGDTLARAWSLLAQQPGAAAVRFSLTGASGARLRADPRLLQQVWLNLFQNAIEAMPGGGALDARITDGPAVRIEVRDSGDGVEEENLAKLFRPFFSTKTRGTGLGLAISRKIVEAHGGSIRIESRAGRGTLVVVEMPR